MKKRNKRIGKQILIGILSGAFLTVLLFSIISVIGLKRVQREINLSDSQVIENIAEIEFMNVMVSIWEDMKGVCENLSLNCSEKMSRYIEELNICTDIIADIYENPDNYGSREIGIPSEETRDKLCLYYSINKALDYESKREEIEKIGCSLQTLQSVYENSSLNSIYYTTKDGILFSFDSNSGEVLDKLEEDQSPLYLHNYEPRETEWYNNSCNDEKGVIKFSSTYLDSTGNLVVTCSQPVYRQDEYMGVMAIDIYLGNLEEELIGIDDINYDGFVEIADKNGNVIVSPNLTENNEDYTNINIFTDDGEGLKEIAEEIISGETGMDVFTYNGQESHIVFMPEKYTGWSIAVIFNTDMVMEEIYKSYDAVMEASTATEENVGNIIENIIVFFAAGAIVIMAAGALLARLVSLRITKPIGTLIKDVNVISGGNLDYRVSISTGNELEELAGAFNKMTSSLKEHMLNLEKVTADKERISTELDVAAQIQLSLLPGQVPAFPKELAFDVCAFMKPAKEVGGDFYDYFMTDENHLWLVAADVSGKGIPASLFMMMGKTLIKNMAKTIGTPASILKAANIQLNEHNDAMMFITCFVCVIELSTGRMTFANAGHNYPFYFTGGKGYIKIENTPDLPLAVMENAEYENHYMDLSEGDSLFLYTDGVTETMNERGELYGEERLCSVLDSGCVREKKNGDMEHADSGDVKISGTDILKAVRADLASFSGEAVQADDITMVIFMYIKRKVDVLGNGNSGDVINSGNIKDIRNMEDVSVSPNSLRVKADLRELSRVIGFVESQLSLGGFSREFITTMKFMADELFSNIAMYAYAENEANMSRRAGMEKEAVITVNVSEGNRAELIFEDWGKPYNPLEREEPDVSLAGEERTEGGLGIYLVRNMADGMEYKYRDGENVVRIWKNV